MSTPGNAARSDGARSRAHPLLRVVPLALTLALAGAAAAEPPPQATPSVGETLGFVLTEFAPAIYHGEDDCPEGLVRTVREFYLDTQTPAERERLQQPENAEEFARKYKVDYVFGPNDTNICSNPELFVRPLQRTVQGRVSYGMRLDDGTDSCPHETFLSPSGEIVDNQLYRVQGCHKGFRGIGDSVGALIMGFNYSLNAGRWMIVLLLHGVDDLRNDDDVELVLATTPNDPILDAAGKAVEGASYTVSSNPRWRNVARGRIENGVLTTEPIDLRLSQRWAVGGEEGRNFEFDLRRARFRLEFEADGSAITGLLGAYQPARNSMSAATFGGAGVASVGGVDCASMLRTLEQYADGVRDPETGECTAVSTAYDVTGIRAYVLDRPDATVAETVAGSTKARER